jgi:hypothetical protein
MRANEFITEGGVHSIHNDHAGAIKNITTFPNQNMNAGNQYLNYRMGIALAGAPEYPTKAASYIAGDPLLAPYTEEEMQMIKYAAMQVGDNSRKTHSSKRSEEMPDVNKVSPVAKWNKKS